MKWKIVNNYEIERFVHRGLSFWKMRAIKKQLKKDPRLQKEVEDLKQSNRDFKNKFPARLIVPEILKRYHNQVSGGDSRVRIPVKTTRRWWIALPALSAALVLVILLLPLLKSSGPSRVGKDIILKGNQRIDFSHPQLLIHRKTNSDIEVLQNGSMGKPGDLLQLAYIAANQAYGVIFSIDGNGKVSLHFPPAGSHSTSLAKEKYFFPEAIELDDAPGFERFFFVTSGSEINVDDILGIARRLAGDAGKAKTASLDLPEGITQVSINIIKEN